MYAEYVPPTVALLGVSSRTGSYSSWACHLAQGASNAPTLNEKFVGVEKIKPVMKLNKPIYVYVGVSISDLSKLHMYQFYYDVWGVTIRHVYDGARLEEPKTRCAENMLPPTHRSDSTLLSKLLLGSQ